MSESIIKVENLSKSFVISHETKERYQSLRDVIAGNVGKIFKRTKNQQNSTEEFWALKDVNFEIKQGDRVGIIGRNGAGKSTLLKILSRITEPTKGRIEINGRVASLLEVGTGFHPELTGRENIFLNGAILGMSRAEIRSKFDEIVAFAEVEKFLDTPVKRYSSGMYVRLAFAVAAHLEPEILIVDEVLAVGDAQFQKKCLGKMEDVSKNKGRTVLFVSHNMHTVSALCSKGILLSMGEVADIGDSIKVLNSYLVGDHANGSFRSWSGLNRPGNDLVKLNYVKIVDVEGNRRDTFRINEPIRIEMEYEVFAEGLVLWQGHNIFNADGTHVFDTHSVKSLFYTNPHSSGIYRATVSVPENLLAEGTFIVSSAIFNHINFKIYFHVKDAVIFNVIEVHDGKTARGLTGDNFPGAVRPLLDWDIKRIG